MSMDGSIQPLPKRFVAKIRSQLKLLTTNGQTRMTHKAFRLRETIAIHTLTKLAKIQGTSKVQT
jgi:hypothetical protein